MKNTLTNNQENIQEYSYKMPMKIFVGTIGTSMLILGLYMFVFQTGYDVFLGTLLIIICGLTLPAYFTYKIIITDNYIYQRGLLIRKKVMFNAETELIEEYDKSFTVTDYVSKITLNTDLGKLNEIIDSIRQKIPQN